LTAKGKKRRQKAGGERETLLRRRKETEATHSRFHLNKILCCFLLGVKSPLVGCWLRN